MYQCFQDFKGSVPGFKVDTIDTTGAGDAFVGSLLVNVAKDDSLFHVRHTHIDLHLHLNHISAAFTNHKCRQERAADQSRTVFIQNEEKLREALKFSNACGAICTTKKGAIPALPTVATAQELIAKAN
jgi:fructokinase